MSIEGNFDQGRILRTVTTDCQQYLAEYKGEPYREYREKWHQAISEYKKADVPLQLAICLTSFCNLRCKMCYSRNMDLKPREYMEMEMVARITREAKELGVASLWVGAGSFKSGSEACLHPDITKILRKFAEADPIDYWFLTNGTLLSAEVSLTLVDLPVNWLTVSLDAATKETYRRIRGGDLDKVEKNIYEFLNIREKRNSRLPFLRVSFVYQEDNADEKKAFQEKWTGVADMIDIQSMVDYRKDTSKETLDLSRVSLCTDLFRHMFIDYDGELRGCASHDDPEFRAYIQDMTIREYWNSEWHNQLAESIRTRQFQPQCIECLKRRM